MAGRMTSIAADIDGSVSLAASVAEVADAMAQASDSLKRKIPELVRSATQQADLQGALAA